MRLDEYERRETEKLRVFMDNIEAMIARKWPLQGVAGSVVGEFLPLLDNAKAQREAAEKLKSTDITEGVDLDNLVDLVLARLSELKHTDLA